MVGSELPWMRGGERPPVKPVYWALATIYLVAAVGYAAATLGEDAATALVAGSHLLAVVPAAAAAGLGEATRIVVELVPQPPTEESQAWHDTMDAWVQGFMRDYRAKRTNDRRSLLSLVLTMTMTMYINLTITL